MLHSQFVQRHQHEDEQLWQPAKSTASTPTAAQHIPPHPTTRHGISHGTLAVRYGTRHYHNAKPHLQYTADYWDTAERYCSNTNHTFNTLLIFGTVQNITVVAQTTPSIPYWLLVHYRTVQFSSSTNHTFNTLLITGHYRTVNYSVNSSTNGTSNTLLNAGTLQNSTL